MLKKFINGSLEKNFVHQIFRYLAVGVSCSFLEILIFYLLLTELKINKIISNTIAYTLIFFYNFFLHRKWTFSSSANINQQIIPYVFLFGFNLFISNTLVVIFIDYFGIHSIISKIMSIGVVVSWNFIIYKKIIFKK